MEHKDNYDRLLPMPVKLAEDYGYKILRLIKEL